MHELSIYTSNIENLRPNEIYSYLIFNGQNISNIDLHSISFKNCIIESVDFSKTLFADSDFDSSHIENCVFENQSFQNADIISCNFQKCSFINVSFKGATMSNNTFNNCVFVSCNFNHVTMNDSSFEYCKFENIVLRQSSTSLNIFERCKWFNCQLHGNFVYNLLIESEFNNVDLEQLVLTSNFGINDDNLKSLGININELYGIQSSLLDNNDLINAAIIELNSNNRSYEASIIFCIRLFLGQLRTNIIVRAEEIKFVELVLSYLLKKQLISPITIIQLLSLIDTFNENPMSNIAINKAKSNIDFIYNTLFKAYEDYVSHLNESFSEIKTTGANVIIKLVFNTKPSIDTCALLSSLQYQLGIESSAPIQIKTEKGSFVEWISAPDNIIKCLQLLVSIIGIFIKIKPSNNTKSPENDTDTKTQESTSNPILVNNVSNNPQYNINGNIVLNIPNIINKQINQIQTEQDISNAINVFIINGMTINNNYQGFNKENLTNIECYYE